MKEKNHSKVQKNTQKYFKVPKEYPNVPTITKKYSKGPKSATKKKVSKKTNITINYQEVPRSTKN